MGDIDWFDVRILAPHFSTAVSNCLAETDADYVRAQLVRHLFAVIELPGTEMYDRHGALLVLRRALGLPPDLADRLDALPGLIHDTIVAGPARRVALLVRHADVPIGADFALFLRLLNAVECAATRLIASTPPIQLLLILTGPAPAFPVVDPPARRRAEGCHGLKVMPADVPLQPWSQPREFLLGPPHQLTLTPAAWYYMSRGHRARGPDQPWNCFEEADRLTFVRAESGWPCLEGLFARTRAGMQLVGLRYEADRERFAIPSFSEDPFTLFRALCQQLAAWQAAPSPE